MKSMRLLITGSFFIEKLCSVIHTAISFYALLQFKNIKIGNLYTFREHSFFRKRGGLEEFREGSLTFCCPIREGQHKFDTTKRWVSTNIYTVLIRLQADLGYKPRPQTSHAKN